MTSNPDFELIGDYSVSPVGLQGADIESSPHQHDDVIAREMTQVIAVTDRGGLVYHRRGFNSLPQAFLNLPTAGKGMNLSTNSLVAGLNWWAFWTSSFKPTCRKTRSKSVRIV